MNQNNKGKIIIYKDRSGERAVDVRLEKDTVWLNAHQMAGIFDIDRTGIVRHIANIYKTEELDKKSTCAKIAQVAGDGKVRDMDYYNLDMSYIPAWKKRRLIYYISLLRTILSRTAIKDAGPILLSGF